jgi:hypothetical protein
VIGSSQIPRTRGRGDRARSKERGVEEERTVAIEAMESLAQPHDR